MTQKYDNGINNTQLYSQVPRHKVSMILRLANRFNLHMYISMITIDKKLFHDLTKNYILKYNNLMTHEYGINNIQLYVQVPRHKVSTTLPIDLSYICILALSQVTTLKVVDVMTCFPFLTFPRLMTSLKQTRIISSSLLLNLHLTYVVLLYQIFETKEIQRFVDATIYKWIMTIIYRKFYISVLIPL